MDTKQRVVTAAAALLVGLITACSSTAPSAPSVAAVVDVTVAQHVAVLSVRNPGRAALFLERCGDRVVPEIDRLDDNTWVNASASVCPATMSMIPLSVEPGETHRDSLTINDSGTYRLRLALMRADTGTFASNITSAPFTVE